MPTLVGARRRGFTPEGFRLFAERIGVAKADSWIEFSVLEDCMREHLNEVAPRRLAVLDPVKLVIDNYPEGKEEEREALVYSGGAALRPPLQGAASGRGRPGFFEGPESGFEEGDQRAARAGAEGCEGRGALPVRAPRLLRRRPFRLRTWRAEVQPGGDAARLPRRALRLAAGFRTRMSALEALLERIRGRKALVGVIGLGYVGLPLALRFSEAGFRVLGFDTDAEKVRRLNAGTSYLLRFPDAAVRKARDSGFEASGARNRYAEPDALILCVPTPLTAHREPDLSFVLGSVEALAPQLRQGQIVSLESTTYPGTTEEELRPRIEARGLRVGEDVFLCFSPEREDPGNPMSVTRAIPKICAGSTPACLEAGLALYGAAIDRVVPVSSTRAAEMTKLLENIHRAVNIGLVNEMKIVADRMGLDIHEIIRAAATKPFGFVPYLPGPGLGGHCIPVDPFYLTWKARQYGVNTRFIELAGEINHAMPGWVMEKLAAADRDAEGARGLGGLLGPFRPRFPARAQLQLRHEERRSQPRVGRALRRAAARGRPRRLRLRHDRAARPAHRRHARPLPRAHAQRREGLSYRVSQPRARSVSAA